MMPGFPRIFRRLEGAPERPPAGRLHGGTRDAWAGDRWHHAYPLQSTRGRPLSMVSRARRQPL